MKQAASSAVFLLCSIFFPEEVDGLFFRNILDFSSDYTALYPRRYNSSKQPL
jgi:hypothetical protein